MEKQKCPELRFKGFIQSWDEIRLGDATNCYSGGTPSVGIKSFYGGDIPFIRSGEINDSKTELFLTEEGVENSSAKLVQKNDVLYALYGATSGEVSLSKINGAINQAILAIIPCHSIESEFIVYWLKKAKTKILSNYLQGGQGNLSAEIVKNLIVNIPHTSDDTEQTQIGHFFQNLDQSIALHEKKLTKTQNFKKAMLEKMFPKAGSMQPEVRLKGFSGDWFETTVGNISTSFSGGTPSVLEKSFYGGEIPFIRSGEISDISTELFLTKSGLENSSAKLVEKGTILYALYGATSGEVSISLISGAINQAILAIKPINKNSTLFLASWLRLNKMRILETYLQGGQGNLSGQIVKNIAIQMPCSFEEQLKIGQLFKQLDQTLLLQQQQLQTLKNLKQAFLEKMFV